jgi:HK97 family phage portal protein
MGVFGFLSRAKPKQPADDFDGFDFNRWVAAPPRRGSSELLDAYKYLPQLRNVVGKVANGVAGARWRAYRVLKNGAPTVNYGLRFASPDQRRVELRAMIDAQTAEEVPDAKVLKLMTSPNSRMTGLTAWKLHTIWKLLVGESFFYKVAGSNGAPSALIPIVPTWVTALPDYSKPRSERMYRVSLRGGAYEIPESMILHFKDVDPFDPFGRGAGTGASLGDELDADEYASRFVKNTLYNNAIPGAIVAVNGVAGTDKDALKAFKESLISEHGGPERANRVMVVAGKEASVTVAKLDVKLTDLQLVELRKWMNAFFREVYGVPVFEQTTKAGAYTAREVFAEQVLEPELEFIRTEMQMRLVPLCGEEVILDYDSPVPEDREHSLKVMQTFREAFTKNEARRVAGHQPVDGGDEFFASAPGSGSNSQTTPEAPEGSAEEAKDEAKKRRAPGDPAWATEPLR